MGTHVVSFNGVRKLPTSKPSVFFPFLTFPANFIHAAPPVPLILHTYLDLQRPLGEIGTEETTHRTAASRHARFSFFKRFFSACLGRVQVIPGRKRQQWVIKQAAAVQLQGGEVERFLFILLICLNSSNCRLYTFL